MIDELDGWMFGNTKGSDLYFRTEGTSGGDKVAGDEVRG